MDTNHPLTEVKTARNKPVRIEKEDIPQLHFPKEEVLSDLDAIFHRKKNLRLATKVGNLDKHKVRIVFEDDECKKFVETTIWSTGNENIVLKRGTIVPINRIHRVHFC